MGLFKSKEEKLAIKEAKLAQKRAAEEAWAARRAAEAENKAKLAELQKKAEEDAKKAEEEARMARLKPYTTYHEWLNRQAHNFVTSLKEQGFNATWGFEHQTSIDFNKGLMSESGPLGLTIFSVPSMSGLAFDDLSETCVYYFCPEIKLSTYLQQEPFYKFHKFSYKDLLGVKVEINDVVSYQSTTVSSNVVGRAMVGGMLAGSVGAAIAGATAPQSTTTKPHSVLKKVSFFLLTNCPDCRTIQFSFHRSLLQSEQTAIADEAIGNAMMSTFAEQPYRMDFVDCQRKNGSTQDCRIERNEGSFKHRNDSEWWRMTEDMWRGHTEDARDRLLDFARKVDAIILANKSIPVISEQTSIGTGAIEEKLLKLKSLLDNGLISQDDYAEKKKEILKDF